MRSILCWGTFGGLLKGTTTKAPRMCLPKKVLPMVQTDSIKMPANRAFGHTLDHLPCVAEEKITRMICIPRGSSNLDPSIYALNGHVTGTTHLERQHERHIFRKQQNLAFGSQDKLYKGTGVICDPIRGSYSTLPMPHLRPYPQEFYGRVYIFYHFQGSSLTLPENPMVFTLFKGLHVSEVPRPTPLGRRPSPPPAMAFLRRPALHCI